MMYVGHKLVFDFELLLPDCTKSRSSASLARRCARYERESNAVDFEKGVEDGLRPYIRKNGEARYRSGQKCDRHTIPVIGSIPSHPVCQRAYLGAAEGTG